MSVKANSPNDACHGTCLLDEYCHCVCLLGAARQDMSSDGCLYIYLPDELVKAHAAPNARQPGVCVLDKDGQRIGLPGDECQGKWHSDDGCQCTFLPNDECPANAAFCTAPARLYAIYRSSSWLAIPSSIAVGKAFCSHFTMRLTHTRGTCHAGTESTYHTPSLEL